jgi:hypothetical protein
MAWNKHYYGTSHLYERCEEFITCVSLPGDELPEAEALPWPGRGSPRKSQLCAANSRQILTRAFLAQTGVDKTRRKAQPQFREGEVQGSLKVSVPKTPWAR